MYTYEYPRPMLTVDAVVFRKIQNELQILLIQRKHNPFEGMWALPGGFMDMNETLETAVCRELEEETGLTGVQFIQLHTFSTVERDPRGRSISVAYYGYAPENATVKGGDDANSAEWFPLSQLPALAFDHKEIVQTVCEKILNINN